MESSPEPNTKGIDASVGGLVWVRRRNGSWWPGRIMGLDELSESCLVSPRSGTPVKLLGREDASVDWYNLEKSKRVKAFRCGEYDDCIDKAKISAANSSKKAVKYARREDAILHALELESARKSKEHHVLFSRTDNSDFRIRQSPMLFLDKEDFHVAEKVINIEGNSSSAQELSQSGISFEEPNHLSDSKVHSLQRKRRKTPNDSEDDGTEGIKRMRGLEDLGMTVIAKRKTNTLHTEGSVEMFQGEGASLSESNNGNSMSNGSPVYSRKSYSSYMQKRRSQLASFYENMKRRNRRRPLTKVLESTAMVSVPVICDPSASPGGSSFLGKSSSKVSALESTESKRTSVSLIISNNSDSTGTSCENETTLNAFEEPCYTGIDAADLCSKMKDGEFSNKLEFLEDPSSDGLYDVPFVGEETHMGGFSPIFMPHLSGKLQSGEEVAQSREYGQVGSVFLRNEGLDDSISTCIAAAHDNNAEQMVEKASSKWQLKGKRNSRNLGKNRSQHSRRYVDLDVEFDNYLVGIGHLGGSSVGSSQKDRVDAFDGTLPPDNCVHLENSRLALEDRGNVSRHWNKHISHRETLVDVQTMEMIGKEEPFFSTTIPDSTFTPRKYTSCHDSHFTGYPMYRMSNSSTRNVTVDSSLFDVNLEVRASYSGRHVPLVSLVSKLNGKAIIGHPLTVEILDDGYCELLMHDMDCCPTSSSSEPYEIPTEMMSDQSAVVMDGTNEIVGNLHTQIGGLAKSHVESQRNFVKHLMVQPSLSPKKSSPKMKKSGLLPKKTRTLSSLTGFQERIEGGKQAAEKLGGAVIACVPLKVVFSRINEALNCSTRPSHNS